MSLTPNRDVGLGRRVGPRHLPGALRAQRAAELEVYEHGLEARIRSECDRLDSQAAADAMRTALDAELAFLDYGMQRMGCSAAKAELVSRKLEMLASSNNQRIYRRFGG